MGHGTGMEEHGKNRPPGFDRRNVHLVANRYTDYSIPAEDNNKNNSIK
jgi:hypothetical protein